MLTLLNPYNFSKISIRALPAISALCVMTFVIGLYLALISSPSDYQQGEMVRIMYVHVPAAWMSLGIYVFIASCSLSSIIFRTKLSYILAVSAAPIGATFALITLVTGSLWGKPMWGTYWVWDARLTSMLVLFLLYLGYIAVVNAGDNIFRAEKPAAALALVGAINVPIVKFSVDLWNSLHQPASVFKMNGPAIHSSMLLPLMTMFAAYILFFVVILILRSQVLIKRLKS
ncbi:MAG: heme ABC transporter permease [Pseudomonadota bacterium]